MHHDGERRAVEFGPKQITFTREGSSVKQFQPGDQVIILIGKRRIGTVVGLRRSSSEMYPYPRYLVKVGGLEKSYLPNTLQAVKTQEGATHE